MDNSSYQEARLQLIKMFNKPSDFRHIIFWYDPNGDFLDDIKADSFNEAKIVVYENNPFTIKTLLEIEDTTSNYLVYFPCNRPKDIENWLLDTLLYSDEYYADMVALTMRKLGLESSKLRDVIQSHLSFFDNKDRINQLSKRIDINDETKPNDFEMAMMASLVKAEYDKIDYILKELIFDYDNGKKYKDLEKFNFKNLLWDLIGEQYCYSGEEKIENLIKSFLVTSVNQNKSLIIDTPVWKNLIIKNSSEACCYFVNEILKKDKRYSDLQEDIANVLRIEDLIKSKGIDSIKSSDEFKVFDRYIINTIVKSLIDGSYDFDFYLKVINDYRLTTRWYDEYINEYEFLRYSILLKKTSDMVIEHDLMPQDYVHKYCDSYYLVDNYYRHAISEYSKINEPTDNETKLIEDIDNTYENKFLSRIGGEFSRALKKIEPNYDFGSIELSKYFFKNRMNRLAKKQFVIISDALRYEVAVDLVNELNRYEKFNGQAKLEHQITTLPSITMFGMASLLPNEKISYDNKQVYVDGKPTNSTEARNKILSDRNSSYSAIQSEKIMAMTRDELREYMNDKTVVYIYHDVIDNAGEHEFGVFEACEKAISELVDLVKKLYNTLQISNYIITSDHGFIYRNKKIDASSKYLSFASLGLDDYSQRYAVIDDLTELSDSNHFKMDYLGGSNSNVYVPYSYDLYRKAGGGIQYIHGGASLQELITPIITLSEMRSRAADNTVEPVKVRLKTATHKIMNKSFSLQFEQLEKVEGKKVSATLNVYLVDENNEAISDKKLLIANKITDNLQERTIDMRFLLKNQEYDRNKRYYLTIENSETGVVLEQIQFVIDIVKFKMF